MHNYEELVNHIERSFKLAGATAALISEELMNIGDKHPTDRFLEREISPQTAGGRGDGRVRTGPVTRGRVHDLR